MSQQKKHQLGFFFALKRKKAGRQRVGQLQNEAINLSTEDKVEIFATKHLF